MGLLTTNDVDFESMRSGGPGGQHGDRRSTAVRLRIALEDIPVRDERREDLRKFLPPRFLTSDDELIVRNGESRSQQRNRTAALEEANEQIRMALEEAKENRKTKQHKRRASSSGGGGGGERDIKEERKKQRRSETTDDLLEQAYEQNPETMDRYVENPSGDDTGEDDGEGEPTD